MFRQAVGPSPGRSAPPVDGVVPANHRHRAAAGVPDQTESETTDCSDDEEEEGGDDSPWGRPARLLRPVGAAVRRLMQLRQLCPQLELPHSFVGGEDSDEERPERVRRPAAEGGPTAAAAGTYWPPSSWAALERQSPPPPPPPRRQRGAVGPGRGRTPAGARRRGAQTHFVDQCRAAAFSNAHDIKITLQRRTLGGDWSSTWRTGWRTLVSEAEAALRRRRYRQAVQLFSKVSSRDGMDRKYLHMVQVFRHQGRETL